MDGKKVIRTKKKRVFKNMKKKMMRLFSLMKKEFLNLDKTFRFLVVMWIVIFFVLLLLLITYGCYRKGVSKYQDVEKRMSSAAIEYVQKEEIYPTAASPLRLSLNVLLEYNYLSDDQLDDSCDGYSKIVYSDTQEEYEVESYLSCKSYTTSGYSSNK